MSNKTEWNEADFPATQSNPGRDRDKTARLAVIHRRKLRKLAERVQTGQATVAEIAAIVNEGAHAFGDIYELMILNGSKVRDINTHENDRSR